MIAALIKVKRTSRWTIADGIVQINLQRIKAIVKLFIMHKCMCIDLHCLEAAIVVWRKKHTARGNNDGWIDFYYRGFHSGAMQVCELSQRAST